jgi:4-azaleucine resistance transporter AzlC
LNATAETAPVAARERRALLRRAFIDSLPVLMGYTTMGFVAGVLLAAKGDVLLSPLWGLLTSACWVTGTMSIAGVGPISERAPVYAFALMTLAVNFRYAFYGFTMLERWKDVPLPRKAYLILMLTDENYALESACTVRDRAKNLLYCTALSVMNHSYWIAGVVAGAVTVCVLGHLINPETIRSRTDGMEFSMAALFLVIFTDQLCRKK